MNYMNYWFDFKNLISESLNSIYWLNLKTYQNQIIRGAYWIFLCYKLTFSRTLDSKTLSLIDFHFGYANETVN